MVRHNFHRSGYSCLSGNPAIGLPSRTLPPLTRSSRRRGRRTSSPGRRGPGTGSIFKRRAAGKTRSRSESATDPPPEDGPGTSLGRTGFRRRRPDDERPASVRRRAGGDLGQGDVRGSLFDLGHDRPPPFRTSGPDQLHRRDPVQPARRVRHTAPPAAARFPPGLVPVRGLPAGERARPPAGPARLAGQVELEQDVGPPARLAGSGGGGPDTTPRASPTSRPRDSNSSNGPSSVTRSLITWRDGVGAQRVKEAERGAGRSGTGSSGNTSRLG